MAGAVVNADARVGEHCIINTGASLDHDCWTGHFVNLMPHAAVGGGVEIGEFSVFGIRASVKHGVKIGSNTRNN